MRIGRYDVLMLARVLLSISLSACGRWDYEDPLACKPDEAPVVRASFTGEVIFAAATATGFVLRIGGFESRIRFGRVDIAKRSGWQWALVRTDEALRVVESVELEDAQPYSAALIVAAGDAVFSEGRTDSRTSNLSRLGASLMPEWTYSTRTLMDGFARGMAASPMTLAHVYWTSSGMNRQYQVELIDAASGTLLWDVPFGPSFGDITVDLEGNAFVASRSTEVGIFRIDRSTGALTHLRNFTSSLPRIESTPTGFVLLRTGVSATLSSHDAAGDERWSLDLEQNHDTDLETLANGDAVVLSQDPFGTATALTRFDSNGAVMSTRHVCASTMLAVDSSNRALLLDDNEIYLQATE